MITDAQARAVLPKLSPDIKRFALQMSDWSPKAAKRYLKYQAAMLVDKARPMLSPSEQILDVMNDGGVWTVQEISRCGGISFDQVKSAFLNLSRNGLVEKVGTKEWRRVPGKLSVYERIREALGDEELTAYEIEQRTGLNHASIHRFLGRLIAEGRVEIVGKRVRVRYSAAVYAWRGL